MFNKCCFPTCTSNYDSVSKKGHVTCFKFPTGKIYKKNG